MKKAALSKWLLCVLMLSTSVVTGCTIGQPNSPDVANTQPVSKEQPITEQPSANRNKEELVIASPGILPSFDPYGVSKKETKLNEFESLIYRGLFTYQNDRTLAPALAAEYRIDRSQNKPAVVITLRKGAVWSDGKPVTVDDVVYTYEEYARPHYYGVWRKWLHLVQGISPFRTGKAPHLSGIVADAKKGTVRFALERDDVTFLQALTAPLLPKHQLAGKPIDQLDLLSREGQIIGAGPFRISKKAEDAWQFSANGGFYGNKPKLAAIRIIPVPQENIVEEINAGKLQWSWVNPEQASQLTAGKTAVETGGAGGTSKSVSNGAAESTDGIDQAMLLSGDANGYHFIGFNMQSPSMKDVGVRRALAQSISTEKIAKESFYGLANSVKSPLATGSFAYAAGDYPAFSADAANAVLAQKGYSKEKPLTLTLVYPNNSKVRERLVSIVEKAWGTLPVKLVKKPLPAEEFAAYLFGGSPTDLYLYAWQYPDDPAELIQMWHQREKVGERGLNGSRYQNPRADQLLERGQLLLPPEERKKLFAEWQKIFSADLPIIPLIELRNNYYVSRHLRGVDEHIGVNPFSRIENWWLE